MLLLQTYAKRIILFGFVISCSITASAMTEPMTDDAKVSQGVGAPDGKKATQTPDVKNVFKFAQSTFFFNSVRERVAMLQQEKLKDEVIVSTVAQEIFAQKINVDDIFWRFGNNPAYIWPIEYTLFSLIRCICRYYKHGDTVSDLNNYDGKPESFHDSAVRELITMIICIEHGAVLKNDYQYIRQLYNALTWAVNKYRKTVVNYKNMGKVLKQIYDDFNLTVLVLAECMQHG